MKSLENSNCFYYHELKFSQKCKNKAVLLKCFENLENFGKIMADFMNSLENPDCHYYHGLKFSQK